MGLLAARPPRVEKLKRRGDVSGLVQALRSEEPSVRAEAASALAQVDAPGVSEELVERLADDEDGVRSAAIAALVERGPARSVEALVAAASGWTDPRSERGRGEAVAALAAMRDPEVGVRLVAAMAERGAELEERDAEVVRRLAGAAEAAPERMVETLVGMLGSGGTRPGQMLVWLAPTSLEPLIGALGEDDKRQQAAIALGYAHDSRAVEPLCRLLLEPTDPAARRVAAWALGEIRDLAAVEALVLATGDRDYEVRTEASRAFDQFGNVGMTVALSALMPQPALTAGDDAAAGEDAHTEPVEPEEPEAEPEPEPPASTVTRERPAPSPERPTEVTQAVVPALRRLLRRRDNA